MIASLLRSCFGPEVATVVATPDMYRGTLLEEETAGVDRMVEKRRLEFTAGRVAARAALARLGVVDFPIKVGPSREPIWPPGVVGTISHCQGLCIAAVAPTEAVAGLGLDIEPATPLDSSLLPMVTTPTERADLSDDSASQPLWGKGLFCIKEAVYKAWFPHTYEPLGFQEVVVEVDYQRGTWVGTIKRAVTDRFPATVRGWIREQDGFLLAGLRVPPAVAAGRSDSEGGNR